MPRLAAPRQLSPHLHVVYAEYPHHDSGNVYLITGRVPTLIDCGSRPAVPQLRRTLAQLGFDITDIDQIIATHGDCDHVQGFHDLYLANPDLELHIHPLDAPLTREPDLYRNAGYLYRDAFTPIPPEPCRLINDGDLVPAGDGELLVVHTPGHTEGAVCLWGEIDGHKVLFAGDTVEGSMRGLEGADLAIWVEAARAWKRSLQRIAGLDIDWVLNGHEPVEGLPLTRARLDRGIASFGKMMNPWFYLGEDEDEAAVSIDAVTPS